MNASRPPAGRPSAGGRTLPQVMESLGMFFHQLGMPPIAGRMLAWLALSDRCGAGSAAGLPRRHRAAIADGRLRLTSLDRRLLRNSRGKSIR